MNIGAQTVITYVLIYSFSGSSPPATTEWDRRGGTVAGTYCLVYALAGAVIGTAAKVLYADLARADKRLRGHRRRQAAGEPEGAGTRRRDTPEWFKHRGRPEGTGYLALTTTL